MSADLSMKILVIILSATLAVFLVLAIVLMIKLIQVAQAIKRISLKAEDIVNKAEDIADKAEAVAGFFQQTAAPVAIGRLLSNIADMVSRKNKGDKDER